MGHARKKEKIDMVTPAITPVQAPQRRKSARERLMAKFSSFVDRASKEMSEKELADAERKTDEFIASVRASLHETR